MEVNPIRITSNVFASEAEFFELFAAIRSRRHTGSLTIHFNQGGMSREMQWTQKPSDPLLKVDTPQSVCCNPLEGASLRGST